MHYVSPTPSSSAKELNSACSLGDGVACAVAGQELPEGHYHLDRMLKPLTRRGEVGCCGTCLDARGLTEAQLVDGARRSTLEELVDWTLWADQVIAF